MNKKTNILVILGSIFNSMNDEYLKDLLLSLFEVLRDKDYFKLNINHLDLFDYDIIKNDYYSIRDILDLFVEYFNFNSKYDIINLIRIYTNLGINRDYLDKLLNDLNDNNDYNSLNNRFKGLFNLLNDSNLVYNSIGLKIVICKYLLDIDISKLNVYQLDNTRLNDKYSFIVFKNNKIKNFSKLYFIDNDIILSTLQHDNISNVVFTLKNNVNAFYGGKNDLDNNNNDIDLSKYKYQYKDNDITNIVKYLYYLIDKYTLFDLGLPIDEVYNQVIDYDSIEVNDNNLYRYVSFFNSKYMFIQKNDLLLDLYNKIIEYLIKNDEYLNNDLSSNYQKRLDNLDYYKYDIDLRDYFLNP